MTKTPMIATAIALGVFCSAAQAQFAARTAPVTPNPFATNQAGPCNTDDGTTENALGLTAGGQMGWINVFTCGVGTIDSVETAYGTAMFPGSVTNGAAGTVNIYDEAGTDPNGFGAPVDSVATSVVNGDTDIVNKIALNGAYTFGGNAGVMATADQVAGQFPGPMDQDNPSPNSWVVGSTLGPGTLDVNQLANNNVPPQSLSSIGFAAVWILRTDNTGGTTGTGTPVCFGDGSGAPCGCGTELAATGGGCGNSLGVGGTLSASGTADTTADSVGLSCSGVRTQPGLFFQADNTIGGGTGITFGDGIRCCGMNVIRLEIVVPPGPEPATATMGVNISGSFPGTISSGDKKCYQFWYRDPGAGNPCGGGNFNLSNAVSITWL
jgi:hypothetical protein